MTAEEKDAALIKIYMTIHVSETWDLHPAVKEAWLLGQQLWCDRQADLLKGIK